jgi:hypothetical protein
MEATPLLRDTLHAVERNNKSIVITTLSPFPIIYHFLSILDFRSHFFFIFQNFVRQPVVNSPKDMMISNTQPPPTKVISAMSHAQCRVPATLVLMIMWVSESVVQ